MNSKWTSLLVAALVLPVGGFVAGSIMSSAADTPPVRQEIIVPAGSDPAESSSDSPGSGPAGEPTRPPRTTAPVTPSPSSSPRGEDDDDDDDGFDVVPPSPSSFDYDDDDDDRSGRGRGGADDRDDDRDGDRDDDNSGPGGGDDD